MYASLVVSPVFLVIFRAMNCVFLGPERTVGFTNRLSAKVLEVCRLVGTDVAHIVPADIAREWRVLRRVIPLRVGACLEWACWLKLWLAFHGQDSQIAVGRRAVDNRIEMHAWLEPEGFGRVDDGEGTWERVRWSWERTSRECGE